MNSYNVNYNEYKTSYGKKNIHHKKNTDSDGFFHVLLYYILPFIIINLIIFVCVTSRPKYKLTVADTNDYMSTEITLNITSWFPLKSVTATLDSEPIELTKQGKKYTASIIQNGVLEINAANINGISSNSYEHITCLDDNPPSISEDGEASIEDEVLTFFISDTQSGVDFTSIYGIDANAVTISPLNYDAATGSVSFDMVTDSLSVFAKDKIGNEVQATFNKSIISE